MLKHADWWNTLAAFSSQSFLLRTSKKKFQELWVETTESMEEQLRIQLR